MADAILHQIHGESLLSLLTCIASQTTPLGPTHIPAFDAYCCSTGMSPSPELPLKLGDVLEIQGPPASGKTHLTYYLLSTCVMPAVTMQGWERAAIVFDTDGSFDIRRFRQILTQRLQKLGPPDETSQVIKQCMARLAIIRVTSTLQLAVSILNVPGYVARLFPASELGMLVVDSISSFYWSDRFAAETLADNSPSNNQPSQVNRFRNVVMALQKIRASSAPVLVLSNWGLTPTHKTPSSNLYRQHLVPFPDPFAASREGLTSTAFLPITFHITTAIDMRWSRDSVCPAGTSNLGRDSHAGSALTGVLDCPRTAFDGQFIIASPSMFRTTFLIRRPYFKLLQSLLGCNNASQHTRTPPMGGAQTYTTTPLVCPPPAKEFSVASSQAEQPVLSREGLSQLQGLIRSYTRTRCKADALRAIQSSWALSSFFSSRPSLQYLTRQLLASNTPDYAIDLMRLSDALGFSMTHRDFRDACFSLSKTGNWKMVRAAVLAARKQIGPLNAALLNWLARSLLQTKNFGKLQSILVDDPQSGAQANRLTFHLMLTGALRNSDLNRAHEIKEMMKKHGYPVNFSTTALVAQSYKTLGADDGVEENALLSLSKMPEKNQVAVLNSLIRGHMNNSNIGRVRRLLSLFDPKSVEIITEAISASGSVREKSTTSYDPLSYPKQLPTPPIPNSSTYCIFIHYCSRRRNLSSAFQLLQCMISQGIPPDQQTVTSLVQTCFSCDRDDLAVQLVAGTCNTPLSLFEPFHPGSWPAHCFEIHVPDMGSSIQIFNALIQGILPKHGPTGAEEVIRIMRLNGVRPNERTLDLILCHMHFVERARPRTLLNLLHTFSGPHLRPTEKHLRIVVRSIQRQGEFILHGQGWDSLKFMKANRQLPDDWKSFDDAKPFDSFAGLTLPMFRQYRALTERFFEGLRKSDIKPNYETVNLRIRHEAIINMDMPAAAAVFRTMLARGMSPNAHHYATLMEGYALTGDTNNARRVFESARNAGIPPSPVLFTILITAYARRADPRGAMKMFQSMVDAGFQPDVPSIDALASGFYAARSNTAAKNLLIRLWSYIGPFPNHLRAMPVLELARHFRTLHIQPRNAETKMTQAQQLELHHKLVPFMNEWLKSVPKDQGRRRTWSRWVAKIRTASKSSEDENPFTRRSSNSTKEVTSRS